MYVVIFRAKIRLLDAEYTKTAARMRELARQLGCTEFHSVSEGLHEISLSYWPDEKSIRVWKEHPEHLAAQQKGRERWYDSYSVQVTQLSREYCGPING